jgi:hypothetical protein
MEETEIGKPYTVKSIEIRGRRKVHIFTTYQRINGMLKTIKVEVNEERENKTAIRNLYQNPFNKNI